MNKYFVPNSELEFKYIIRWNFSNWRISKNPYWRIWIFLIKWRFTKMILHISTTIQKHQMQLYFPLKDEKIAFMNQPIWWEDEISTSFYRLLDYDLGKWPMWLSDSVGMFLQRHIQMQIFHCLYVWKSNTLFHIKIYSIGKKLWQLVFIFSFQE